MASVAGSVRSGLTMGGMTAAGSVKTLATAAGKSSGPVHVTKILKSGAVYDVKLNIVINDPPSDKDYSKVARIAVPIIKAIFKELVADKGAETLSLVRQELAAKRTRKDPQNDTELAIRGKTDPKTSMYVGVTMKIVAVSSDEQPSAQDETELMGIFNNRAVYTMKRPDQDSDAGAGRKKARIRAYRYAEAAAELSGIIAGDTKLATGLQGLRVLTLGHSIPVDDVDLAQTSFVTYVSRLTPLHKIENIDGQDEVDAISSVFKLLDEGVRSDYERVFQNIGLIATVDALRLDEVADSVADAIKFQGDDEESKRIMCENLKLFIAENFLPAES